ncbi:uncharacterized protein LOC109806796 isoform X2 [Cajanus cajan]|nr:uncharacterized protein LOC109806796 isoform X2 [Cajanus cajan]
MPITRYFECATQPRQLRYTSSTNQNAHLRHLNKPRTLRNYNKQETRYKRNVNGNKGKVYDVREQARKPTKISKEQQDDTVPRTPKPIDEDLYKIPPELLHTSNKRKKMVGFISKCLVLFVCHEQC